MTGRIVDENGKPLPPGQGGFGGQMPATLFMGNWRGIMTNSDATAGEHPGGQTDPQGRFRLEQLVPGLRYRAEIYRGMGMFAGMAFENLVLKPGWKMREQGEIYANRQ